MKSIDKKSQNLLNNGQNQKNNYSNQKVLLNNSFSKEFINAFSTINEDDEDNLILAKSHSNLGDLIKMEEQIIGESKEVSPTILDKKIKNMSSKNINIPKIKNIVINNDMVGKDIERNNIVENDNYIKIREIPEISQDNFEKIKYDLLDDNFLEELKNFIINFNYEVNSDNTTLAVGSLFPLERLIESSFNYDPDFMDEMISKYNLYKEYICNFRTIKGDGNCYYRAVMIRYFEIIILNKEISLLKNVIYDMKNSFYSNEITKRKEIKMNTTFKPELPLKIMILILDLIIKNDIELAHLIFIKSLLICQIFDYGLIFYFRYIIYNYIKENENKLYLTEFPIKIGNLLPSKYETEDGEFLFNSFYQNYLLKMFMDAEKIIIYLTPFILGINLDIIVFNDDSEIIKKINYEGNPKYSFNDKIFLMNRKNHYELIYSKKENIKYNAIFNKYINNHFLEESIIYYELQKNINKDDDKKNKENFINNKDEEENKEINTLLIPLNSINANNNFANSINNGNLDNINKAITKKKKKKKKKKVKNELGGEKNKLKNNQEKINEEINSDKNIDGINNSQLKIKNEYNCIKCNNIYIKNILQNNFNLCYNCLKVEIIEKFCELYLDYIRNGLNEEYDDTKIEIKYKELIARKIKINNVDISIDNSINELNDFSNNNNSSLDTIDSIIFEIKQNVCLICCYKITNNEENRIYIPCGCNFCSSKHFEYYFKEKKPIQPGEKYICYCSHKYNKKEIYNIGVKFSKDYFFLRKQVFKYLNYLLKEKCCLCESDKPCSNKIKYKDENENEEENTGDIFDPYNELKHHFCKECNEKIKNKDKFYCKICEKKHIFKTKK